MTFLSNAIDRWETGPYAMQGVASIFREKNGSVLIQLRTAADNIFDQVVLGSRGGADEQEVLETLMAENGVDEIIPAVRSWQIERQPEYDPIPRFQVPVTLRTRYDIMAAMRRCEDELALLRAELRKSYKG